MFPYLGEIQIPTQEILPSVFVDDLLTLAGDTKLLYELAVTFDQTLDGDYYQKTNYRYIILALMEVQMDGEPFPEKRIWKSIFSNEEEDFRKCCNEFSTSWAKIITMKPIFCDEMRTVQKDPRMNRLKLKKWKPLHFMVYFDRAHLLNDILEFSGTSITKTIAIENKKKGTRDEFLSLKICINMKNSRCFRILWKESSVWTVKHLFLVIKELADPQMYSEKIHKVILTSQTTIDILKYSNKTIRKQLKRQIKALQDSKT
uniref:Uncharacterized protein n=1 Tax=Euplotes harpa TaxID=151035 RepID=A0A7S3J8X3_9SPIT|mmetsp:Transcript_2333/g.3051  ORF Transcript_2333/g.3051 Transcript_2333/m.3051 type:complete len:259 (+) Transcript_2333:1120-1896(+)